MHKVVCLWIIIVSTWYYIWDFLSSRSYEHSFQMRWNDIRDIFKCMDWKMHYKWNMFKIFKPSHVSGWHLWMNWTAVSMRSKLCPPPLASASASAPLLQITTSLSSFPPRLARTMQCVRVCLRKCVCLLTELCSFPLQMGNWKNATVLFLHSNKLESLPEEMGDMQKLKVINLSNNKWVGPDAFFKHSEGEFVTHSKLSRNSTKTGTHFAFKEHALCDWMMQVIVVLEDPWVFIFLLKAKESSIQLH